MQKVMILLSLIILIGCKFGPEADAPPSTPIEGLRLSARYDTQVHNNESTIFVDVSVHHGFDPFECENFLIYLDQVKFEPVNPNECENGISKQSIVSYSNTSKMQLDELNAIRNLEVSYKEDLINLSLGFDSTFTSKVEWGYNNSKDSIYFSLKNLEEDPLRNWLRENNVYLDSLVGASQIVFAVQFKETDSLFQLDFTPNLKTYLSQEVIARKIIFPLSEFPNHTIININRLKFNVKPVYHIHFEQVNQDEQRIPVLDVNYSLNLNSNMFYVQQPDSLSYNDLMDNKFKTLSD